MTGSPVLRKTGSLSVQCPETSMANFHPGVTMIRSSFALLFSIFMVFGACTLCGQELKGLVVVDIASCVDQYRKTASERERLEALSKEKSSPLEQERQDIEAMGGKHKRAGHGEVVFDERYNLVTSPCYMLDASVAQIADGAEHAVSMLLERIG